MMCTFGGWYDSEAGLIDSSAFGLSAYLAGIDLSGGYKAFRGALGSGRICMQAHILGV